MRAALITAYGEPLTVAEVADPEPTPDGIVLEVEATGICRSDWHAWMGHESLPGLPHVPGHEMAGVVAAVGQDVRMWAVGDRVSVPFSIGCGRCRSCTSGQLNTCDEPFTPGFTAWGSFAELVAIDHADQNLVALPAELGSVPAAALGCRVVTAFRALADRRRLAPREWLAVHGCGGVGLSAVMIGEALGARVVAVDISREKLALAAKLGAEATIDATGVEDAGAAVRDLTGGGADVSIDALGDPATFAASVGSLRKHGRHVQVGLVHAGALPASALELVVMRELELVGSRGMPATEYPRVLALLASGAVDPARLVTRTVSLDEAGDVLASMTTFAAAGIAVIDTF